MEYSGAEGKLIHEKNQKQKISWHCPFKFVSQKIGIELCFAYTVYFNSLFTVCDFSALFMRR
jgi:hypothetical protein